MGYRQTYLVELFRCANVRFYADHDLQFVGMYADETL